MWRLRVEFLPLPCGRLEVRPLGNEDRSLSRQWPAKPTSPVAALLIPRWRRHHSDSRPFITESDHLLARGEGKQSLSYLAVPRHIRWIDGAFAFAQACPKTNRRRLAIFSVPSKQSR